MPAFAFDTLKATRALTAAGAKEPLAEAIVITMNEAVAEGVATKADIAEVKAELAEVKAELAEVRTEVKTELAEVKTELAEARAEAKADIAGVRAEISAIKWVLGVLIGIQILMAGRLFGAF